MSRKIITGALTIFVIIPVTTKGLKMPGDYEKRNIQKNNMEKYNGL